APLTRAPSSAWCTHLQKGAWFAASTGSMSAIAYACGCSRPIPQRVSSISPPCEPRYDDRSLVASAEPTPLRRLLDARDVKVVYQPVVDLRTQKVFAYEALVRSKSPAFGNPMELFAAAVSESCTGELGRMIREMSLEGCP